MRNVEYRDLIDELKLLASGANEVSPSFGDELHEIYTVLADMARSESTIEAVRYVLPATGNCAAEALTTNIGKNSILVVSFS